MEETINNAIKFLASKVNGETKADDALKYTQAALNLAHTKAILSRPPTQQ